MTLSIIALVLSMFAILLVLCDIYFNLKLEEYIDAVSGRLRNIETNVDKWNSYGEILGYENKDSSRTVGYNTIELNRKRVFTKWNALLDYLKIEWKEGKVEPHFEKKK